ncbi:MAG TPA: PEP-CTERM sorting domain-containing protein [Candidatus Omnitrophota bacterium]|nr:PEP-CTERM sorting domain-containing protein [Candidatus Omnitrophota bacterium]HPD85198.1 PEP-CTERM sorting domain-containing protein [Candidatus Omnitrophota bacterium]HRZ04301.1 PEP-CTERM sorting domain-containing protein [Candidatus Omnitrophota bacterium]
MSRLLRNLFLVLAILALTVKAEATLLTFDTDTTPGITLGGGMLWNGIGGGHLYNEWWNNDDDILFSSPIHLNDFQMNAMPWELYGGGDIGFIDIAAFDAGNNQLWQSTVDLSNYTDWSNWLTVSVDADNVSRLTFYAPGIAPHYNGFWPSIDNVRINEDGQPTVPEPASLSLLGLGLLGLLRRRRVS